MIKQALILQRVATKTQAMRDAIFRKVEEESPEEFDGAFQNQLAEVRWGGDQNNTFEMGQLELENLVYALEARQKEGPPFGPIEKAALDLVAMVTKSEGFIERQLTCAGRFRTTLPELFHGSATELRAKLRFGMGVNATYPRYAEVFFIKCDELDVTVVNGYPTVMGLLSFTLHICSDADVPGVLFLKDQLSVMLTTDAVSKTPDKFERTSLRDLEIRGSRTY